jgi:NTE family protein
VPQRRTPFEQIALLLQGGGALGAYQAGVYEALAEADLHPDWVAGISIGAINSAIIAGNPPKQRVDALREFWHAVSTSPFGIPYFQDVKYDDTEHQLLNQARHGRPLVRRAEFLCAAPAAAGRLATGQS